MKKIVIILFIINFATACKSKMTLDKENIYPPETILINRHSDWTKAHYPQRIKSFKKEPLMAGDIAFIGNSITEQGGNWAKRLNNAKIKNRGISGEVTEGVLARLGEIYHFKPSKVFIKIGINDLFTDDLTAAYVGNNILKIVQNIHLNCPKTKIYVQTILPTSTENIALKIKTVNTILKNNAIKNHFVLIDLYSVFADEKDIIKTALTTDGVHLNEVGYNIWTNYIKKYVD
jgi:lysophospholipase L1-like esterase